MKGVPDIKIQGNVIKIDRKDVVWSSDEYESDEEETNSKVDLLGNRLPRIITHFNVSILQGTRVHDTGPATAAAATAGIVEYSCSSATAPGQREELGSAEWGQKQ